MIVPSTNPFTRVFLSLLLLLLLLLLFSLLSLLLPTPNPSNNLSKCSNHGLYDPFTQTCTCDQCYSSPTCQTHNTSSCILFASSGNPQLFETYWATTTSPNDGTLPSIPSDWRIGHDVDKHDQFYPIPELHDAITELHFRTNNSVQGEIVIGIGSTQLFHAALYAFQHVINNNHSSSLTPLNVYAPSPYYPDHESISHFTPNVTWIPHPPRNCTSQPPLVEVLTIPNNPDGVTTNTPHCPPSTSTTTSRVVLYDHAYLWPHYTHHTTHTIPCYDESSIRLFTLTKLTGHAGSRIGWAFVPHPKLAQYMREYVDIINHGVPHESQLRAAAILTAVDYDMLHWAKSVLEWRWTQLEQLFLEDGQETFRMVGREKGATPPYLWMQCLTQNNCFEYCKRVGNIVGKKGTLFGADASWVRFTLLNRPSEFELLWNRLRGLIKEDIQTDL